jgi:hypothetical protein
MAAKLFQADTVVVGRFNPHIITPDWVTREGIVDSDKVQLVFGLSGRELIFQFKTREFDWRVDYGRLVVATNDPSADPAAKVAEVIEKLPHTPLSALGNNFRFRSPLQVWSAGLPCLGKNLGFQELGSQGKVLEVSWSFKVEKEAALVLGVTLEQTADEVHVNMNLHRAVTDKDQAIAAARRFSDDRKVSRELLVSLIGEKAEE